MFDIHSHILPEVDDGSKSLEESIKLLKMMKYQNITDVMATPHFYAYQDNFENYTEKITSSFAKLKRSIEGMNLPNIYLGSEILYFKNISSSESINKLCFNGSKFILIELANNQITDSLFEDLLSLKNDLQLIPIIAHIERYYKFHGYNRLIDFIINNKILTQINAASVVEKPYNKTVYKLIKKGCAFFIGTDTHSVESRPPMMDLALQKINEKFGNSCSEIFIKNSQHLLKEITTGSSGDINV